MDLLPIFCSNFNIIFVVFYYLILICKSGCQEKMYLWSIDFLCRAYGRVYCNNTFALVLELTPKLGEVAVITGGARGIGVEVVQKLLECRMYVVIGKVTLFLYLKKKI